MNDEQPDDVPYFVTCAYCGTQTGLSFKQLENNRPLKCRVCGAPLKIVPPPKRPAKKRKKRPCDYYLLHAERTEHELRFDKKSRVAEIVCCIVIVAFVVIAFILMLLID